MNDWWTSDSYDDTSATGGLDKESVWGPVGPALVRLYDNGKTDPGWGLVELDRTNNTLGAGFMKRYMRRDFYPLRILHGYQRGQHAFAWVMRSGSIIAIDIDGKNGGFEFVSRLGYLPPTLAETSKSGNGYHLFYSVEDEWSDTEGFGAYHDHIGIETGVDVRGTGCIYHYPSQGWNQRALVPAPAHLAERLQRKAVLQTNQRSTIVKSLDTEEDAILMHEKLKLELKQKIPAGKRNITLYALGSQMMLAEVPDWETLVGDRATQLGLDDEEIEKILRNVKAYGAAAATTP